MNNLSNPLISIIVPCYKQAQYLSECLQSVIEQTYQNWECIIVDDGSPDDTKDISKTWCLKDKRIKYLYKDNDGVSAARNAGIAISQGQWILPLDADDKIAPQYLELAVQVIEKDDNVGIIYCEAEFFGDKTGKWELEAYDFEKLLIKNQIFCTAFYKKADWGKIGGYDINMTHGYEDWEFWVNLINTTNTKVERINYIGFYYRIKSDSRNTNLNSFLKSRFDMEMYVIKKHSNLYLTRFGSICNILDENMKYKELLTKKCNVIALSEKLQNNVLYRIIRRFVKL